MSKFQVVSRPLFRFRFRVVIIMEEETVFRGAKVEEKTGKIICILGVTGEHLGPEIARWAVKKDGVVARMLVRDGFQTVEKKKKVVDELLRLGCELHLGDASDVKSLVLAFTGADVVISSLGTLFDSDSSQISNFKPHPLTLTLILDPIILTLLHRT